jgi:hypothetical protein
MNNLKAITVQSKNGEESFLFSDKKLNFKLIDFWSWSQSNLLSNSLRGVLAEFIVKTALDIKSDYRLEWDAYDLETRNGLKIEVKSSAYLQSWKQTTFSKISFDISPKKGWNSETNEYAKVVERQSDFYIFCILKHQDKRTVNPLNLNQWLFYLLPTQILNEQKPTQKTISLNSLLKLNPKECKFDDIKNEMSS